MAVLGVTSPVGIWVMGPSAPPEMVELGSELLLCGPRDHKLLKVRGGMNLLLRQPPG